MSGGVCESCHGKGSTEYRAAVCDFFVLSSVTMPPQHMENYSRPLEMMQYQEHTLSLAQNVFWRQKPCWRWAAQRMTTSNSTERWKRSTGKRPSSIRSKINRLIADEVNMIRENVRLIPTEEMGVSKFVPRWYPEISHSNSGMCGWAQFLTSKCITVMPQPPYSPDLAPGAFLFWKSKNGSERTPFWVKRRHPEVCNAGLKIHPTNCLPEMLQTMAAPLE